MSYHQWKIVEYADVSSVKKYCSSRNVLPGHGFQYFVLSSRVKTLSFFLCRWSFHMSIFSRFIFLYFLLHFFLISQYDRWIDLSMSINYGHSLLFNFISELNVKYKYCLQSQINNISTAIYNINVLNVFRYLQWKQI